MTLPKRGAVGGPHLPKRVGVAPRLRKMGALCKMRPARRHNAVMDAALEPPEHRACRQRTADEDQAVARGKKPPCRVCKERHDRL